LWKGPRTFLGAWLVLLCLAACTPATIPTSRIPGAALSEINLDLAGQSYYLLTVVSAVLVDELKVEGQGIAIVPVRRSA
jgi:hypothetical protein